MNRNKRIVYLSVGGIAIAGAAALTFAALSQNIDYFYSPQDVTSGKADTSRRIRLGGLVADGSIRDGNGVAKVFDITDGAATVSVVYDGILPDLFREGQGVIAQGRFDSAGVFQADIILAKHDENYQPKELSDALDRAESPKGY